MSSFTDKPKEIFSKKFKSYNPFPSENNKNKKCPIRKSIGMITPKDTDNFQFISFNNIFDKIENENNDGNSNKKIIKINIVDNSKNIIWSKNPFIKEPIIKIKENKNSEETNMDIFKPSENYIRIIDKDSIETIIPCKPMLNSTASKSYVAEYSKSKKYQEDIISPKILIDNSNNSSFSDSTKSNNNNFSRSSTNISTVNFTEEGRINYDLNILRYQEEHLPVPIEQKDNENFKIISMKKMKKKSMPPNKSAKKFAEDIEPQYEKDFRINNSFCKLLKRKIVHSYRRIYCSNFILGDGKEKVNFLIFRDKDIGVYEYWQAHIHENYKDEDVETEDDQKKLAEFFVIDEIKESFRNIKKFKYEEIFVNFNRFKSFYSKEQNEKIKIETLNLKNQIDL